MSFACNFAVPKGSTDTHCEEDPGGDIGHGHAWFDWASPWPLTRDTHDAGHALGDEIETSTHLVWASSSKSTDSAIDDLRVEFTDIFVTQTESFEYTGAEIFQDHIGIQQHLFCYSTAFWRLQIKRQCFLIAI